MGFCEAAVVKTTVRTGCSLSVSARACKHVSVHPCEYASGVTRIRNKNSEELRWRKRGFSRQAQNRGFLPTWLWGFEGPHITELGAIQQPISKTPTLRPCTPLSRAHVKP